MPLPTALCLFRPLCAEVKGLPSGQKQPKWTGTGQASGTFTQKKKKKLAHPFQVRGSQSTRLKSRAHSMGSQLPQDSSVQQLNYTDH